jgi:hypothetical protein
MVEAEKRQVILSNGSRNLLLDPEGAGQWVEQHLLLHLAAPEHAHF